MLRSILLCLTCSIPGAAIAEVTLPQTVDQRLAIELFAAEPEIVTPCGLAVDARGRVLVVESHTHFRPKNYQGPPADRIRMLVDTNGDGRADQITTFFEGTRSTMNVAVHPDGSVYVATRMEIFRLRDTDDDGTADERTPIAHLETRGNYPHNGLSGFAFDLAGNVYFGLGENLGSKFKLIGTDGSLVSDLEGGQVYRCRADGGQIERVAFGFWNPFHVAFDAFGRLFAVDNDPDSLPPCRLLHLVQGGNYGYRYRNGRKGVHPFTAWNGELPGTLPMVAGTGEAPSGVVAYESDQLPEDYTGNLLVTSWGDHRLERYRLEPRGASFRAVTEAFVKGDENFRPVGIAVAPDGSLLVSDWVLQDYNVHGKGRVWRVRALDAPPTKRPSAPAEAIHSADRPTREHAARALASTVDGRRSLQAIAKDDAASTRVRALAITALHNAGDAAAAELALADDPSTDVRAAAARLLGSAGKLAQLRPDEPSAEVRSELWRRTQDSAGKPLFWKHGADSDAFVAQAAREALFRLGAISADADLTKLSASQRLATLLVLRERAIPGGTKLLPRLLKDPDPDVRFAAVQWVGEERLKEFRQPLVEALSAGPATARLFGGYLSALERVDGTTRTPDNEWAGQQYMVRALADPQTPAEARRWALRMLKADNPLLTGERLRQYLQGDDETLRLEAIRTLRDGQLPERDKLLSEVAASQNTPARLRAEAIVGLSATTPELQKLLLDLACGQDAAISHEALRSLRGAVLDQSARARLQQAAADDAMKVELIARILEPPQSAPPAGNVDTWLNRLAEGDSPGDAQAGERIFFHRQSAACARCHQIGGRGARIGPELTATTGVLDERRLVESIVDPSREVAPHFVTWLLLTTSGESYSGVLVGELATGEQTYADQQGQLREFKPGEIETRRPLPTSLMPDGLPAQMTVQEFRDLLAFLRSPG